MHQRVVSFGFQVIQIMETYQRVNQLKDVEDCISGFICLTFFLFVLCPKFQNLDIPSSDAARDIILDMASGVKQKY